MATGPVRIGFGPFVAGGEGTLIHTIDANVQWNAVGVTSSTFDVKVDGRFLRQFPMLGSTHIPHSLVGGQDQALLQFDNLFPQYSKLEGGVADFAELFIKLGDLRHNWHKMGTFSLIANQTIAGESPLPAAQTAGSHNPNEHYPTQFWRSVTTILRELMMRLNVAPGDLILDGTQGFLDLRSEQVPSRRVFGVMTPIGDDCPIIKWEEVPVVQCLQDLLDKYQLELAPTPQGKVGFRKRSASAVELDNVVQDWLAVGAEVQQFTTDTNKDAEADAIYWYGEPIIVEDFLTCEPVIRDPHREGHYVSMRHAESLAAVGIAVPGSGLPSEVADYPAIGTSGIPVIVLWHQLALSSPPFGEIHDERLRAYALEAFHLWRIYQPRIEVPDGDTGDKVSIAISPEGTTFDQQFRVPRLTKLNIRHDTGTIDPGGGGQVTYDPDVSPESAEPWRILPPIPLRHQVRPDGTFEMVPHQLLVKNAINPDAISTINEGSRSSTARDYGPVVQSPSPDEPHENAVPWSDIPKVLDAADGVFSVQKAIYGHNGEVESGGDRSALAEQLSWLTNKGITADVWETVNAYGMPLVYWNGSFQLQAFNDPLFDVTTARSFASTQLWLEAGRSGTWAIPDLPEIPVSTANPAKAWVTVRTEKLDGLQLHGKSGRIGGTGGGGTSSFTLSGGWSSQEWGGRMTFHDVGQTGGAPGTPGFLDAVSVEHVEEIRSTFQSAQFHEEDRLGEYRVDDRAVRGASMSADGWLPQAVAGRVDSWPIERATFRAAGNDMAVTNLLINGRGPRLDFGDVEASRDLARRFMQEARTLGNVVGSESASAGVWSGGGASGGAGGPAATGIHEPGIGARTLVAADFRSPPYADETGGFVHEVLGECGIIDMPNGRQVMKGRRHSHLARGYVPGDLTELLQDEVELKDGDKRFAAMEGMIGYAPGARDRYHSGRQRTPGTRLKQATQQPVRNIYTGPRGVGEADCYHADNCWKGYLFFDHEELSAGDAIGSGGQMIMRVDQVTELSEVVGGARYSLSWDEITPFTVVIEEEEPPEEAGGGEPIGEGGEGPPVGGEEPVEEEPDTQEFPIDPGYNWGIAILIDSEDFSSKGAGNRYFREGIGTTSQGVAVTSDNVEDWNLLTVAGTSSAGCDDYCGIAQFNPENTAGFIEDMDCYSWHLHLARNTFHIEELYKQNGLVQAALMAWSYAHQGMIDLLELICCIKGARNFRDMQDCACELFTVVLGHLCPEDCEGNPTPDPSCVP